MYLDKPKSPSFTQSTEDTRTFRAAMSLRKGNITKVLSRWTSSADFSILYPDYILYSKHVYFVHLLD